MNEINPGGTVSLCIMSGKGGVGKTNIALSLSYALKDLGHNLMLMDCDLGLANLDILLGLTPERNLQDLISGEATASEVVLEVEPGLNILPAASGVPELVEMDQNQRDALFHKLRELIAAYDFLLLDLGAGINETVLSLARMVQMRIVLVTPEPTSLTDGYAVIKVLHARHGVRDFCVVVNQATPDEAQETFQRLNMACKNFLGFELVNLGYVRMDKAVTDAVRHQVPLAKHAPNSLAYKDISLIAARIAHYRRENLAAVSARTPLRDFS
jgi:flagellar biosynthesis protein FlhG